MNKIKRYKIMSYTIKCFKKFFTHFIPTEEYESTFIQ